MSQHPATPAADRALYAACARLEKSLSTHTALRSLIASPLPIAAAEAQMDDIEDHLSAIRAKLTGALLTMTAEVDRIQEAEEIEYARAHGVTALAANDGYVPVAVGISKRITPARPANDDELLALVTTLRSGVL
jgi:hypothetical protein